MNIWLAWQDGDNLAYLPIVRAALAHEAFLNIHPFYDWNGRLARLLLNLQLMCDGYPTVLIQRNLRETYIRALEAAHFSDYQALVAVVGQAVDAGLSLWLDACERAPEDYKPLAREVAAATRMDAAYLGWLLRNQRVEGSKVGGRWYTSEAAVRRYRDEVARCPSTWPAKTPLDVAMITPNGAAHQLQHGYQPHLEEPGRREPQGGRLAPYYTPRRSRAVAYMRTSTS